jgi:hypothetical protein
MMAGNSKSNMALAADPPSPLLSHYRYGAPVSVMKIHSYFCDDPDVRTIEEPVIYGGPLFRHFGHALSESIHRLWPRFASKELAGAKVAFSVINNTKVMPYVVEALNLHGISRSEVIRIDEDIRFRRLFVGPQARQMAGPTLIPGYQKMLDSSLERRLPPPGGGRHLYVSRLHHHHTGSFFGESFVETALAAEGFEIIYPEHHTVTELVTMLRASSVAVFAEGSAIHALELCGSATPAVFVIGRRSGSVERFTPLLSNICKAWKVSDRLLFNAGMSSDKKKHSGLLDLAGVFDDLQAFLGRRIGDFDWSGAASGVLQDVELHIEDPRNGQSECDSERAAELRALVRRALSATTTNMTSLTEAPPQV